MAKSFDPVLFDAICEYLEDTGFELTERRIHSLYYYIGWENMLFPIDDKLDINKHAERLYNYKRVKNTKLAKKMNKDDILHETDKWLLIRWYHDKK